jgi:hypothetical protein
MEQSLLTTPHGDDGDDLFTSICSTLRKMFVADNGPRRRMLEMGLVETMVGWL